MVKMAARVLASALMSGLGMRTTSALASLVLFCEAFYNFFFCWLDSLNA